MLINVKDFHILILCILYIILNSLELRDRNKLFSIYILIVYI